MADENLRLAAVKRPAMAAAGLEVLTGAALVATPSLLAQLLFGSVLSGSGELVARIAGIVMICLAAGCWPRTADRSAQVLEPLIALSGFAALYLLVVGLGGTNVGPLLWPALLVHLGIGILLGRGWLASRA